MTGMQKREAIVARWIAKNGEMKVDWAEIADVAIEKVIRYLDACKKVNEIRANAEDWLKKHPDYVTADFWYAENAPINPHVEYKSGVFIFDKNKVDTAVMQAGGHLDQKQLYREKIKAGMGITY